MRRRSALGTGVPGRRQTLGAGHQEARPAQRRGCQVVVETHDPATGHRDEVLTSRSEAAAARSTGTFYHRVVQIAFALVYKGSDEQHAAMSEDFSEFFQTVEPRIRRALVAAYGAERGREATCEAMAFAWEHWADVRSMGNPAGYLFRVGQSASRQRRRPVMFPAAAETAAPWVEPGLPAALAELTEHQRVAVVLCHGFGWTHREVADFVGLSRSSVQTHLERGLARLRDALEARADA